MWRFFLSAKNSFALFRKLLKNKRSENFREFCNVLNRKYPTSEIWRKIPKISRTPISLRNSLPPPHSAEEILCVIDDLLLTQAQDGVSVFAMDGIS